MADCARNGAESSFNDEQLSEGARQAVEARDVFRKDQTLLRRVLELADDQTIDRIEAVVVSRGAEQTGFLYGRYGRSPSVHERSPPMTSCPSSWSFLLIQIECVPASMAMQAQALSIIHGEYSVRHGTSRPCDCQR